MEYEHIYSQRKLSIYVLGDKKKPVNEHYKIECENRYPIFIYTNDTKTQGVSVDAILHIAKHMIESSQEISPRLDYQKSLDYVNKALNTLNPTITTEEKLSHG